MKNFFLRLFYKLMLSHYVGTRAALLVEAEEHHKESVLYANKAYELGSIVGNAKLWGMYIHRATEAGNRAARFRQEAWEKKHHINRYVNKLLQLNQEER